MGEKHRLHLYALNLQLWPGHVVRGLIPHMDEPQKSAKDETPADRLGLTPTGGKVFECACV